MGVRYAGEYNNLIERIGTLSYIVCAWAFDQINVLRLDLKVVRS